jgi:hypothetical protein
MVGLCRLPSARLMALAVAPFLVLCMRPTGAGAQIHGSLEKLIVELPDGCSSRRQPPDVATNGGTFPFAYDCHEHHVGAFTVSFPSSVEATGFDGGWYQLAGTAIGGASVTWTWTSPANVPGGVIGFTDFRLRLGTTGSVCVADPKISQFLEPGTYTFESAESCALPGLASWSSGEPGDSALWAHYFAAATFRASDVNFVDIVPPQTAMVHAIYRMEVPLGPDLDVDIGDEQTFVNEPPVFPVNVTNRGDTVAPPSRLLLDITDDLPISDVTVTSSLTCIWIKTNYAFHGDCSLGSLAAGASAELPVTVLLWKAATDQRVKMKAEVVPGDSNPANDVAEDTKEFIFCSEAFVSDCLLEEVACRSSSTPLVPPGSFGSIAAGARSMAIVARALATSPIDIGSFRRLRDEILVRTAAGRRFGALYDAYTAEVTTLALADPDLLAAMIDGVLLWQPHVRALVEGNGASAQITPEQIAALAGILKQLKALGSPELRVALEREESTLDIPALAGTSMDEALARAEATSLRRRLRPRPR